jgi:hypothetical protein
VKPCSHNFFIGFLLNVRFQLILADALIVNFHVNRLQQIFALWNMFGWIAGSKKEKSEE